MYIHSFCKNSITTVRCQIKDTILATNWSTFEPILDYFIPSRFVFKQMERKIDHVKHDAK